MCVFLFVCMHVLMYACMYVCMYGHENQGLALTCLAYTSKSRRHISCQDQRTRGACLSRAKPTHPSRGHPFGPGGRFLGRVANFHNTYVTRHTSTTDRTNGIGETPSIFVEVFSIENAIMYAR